MQVQHKQYNNACKTVSEYYKHFQTAQFTAGNNSDKYKESKKMLITKLKELRETLDIYLSETYGLGAKTQWKSVKEKKEAYQEWKNSHQPFHWFAEFYEIISKGGFDVVISNPPYVEYSKVKDIYQIKGYDTESCGNLYAFVMERSMHLCNPKRYISMIVPISGHSTERMVPLIKHFYNKHSLKYIFNISADAHPSVLFQGVKFRLAVFIVSNKNENVYTTKYQKFYAEERNNLFEILSYTTHGKKQFFDVIGKFPNPIALRIMEKISVNALFFYQNTLEEKHCCYYHNTPVNWIRSHSFIPYFRSERDGEVITTQLKKIYFSSENQMKTGSAILCSSLFFIWWLMLSDCYHLNKNEIQNFNFSFTDIDTTEKLCQLSDELSKDMMVKSKKRVYNYKTSGRVEYDEFYMKKSKIIIDKIDKALAQHYGFTEEELDYIINYDIKYRMGSELEGEE